MSSPRASLQVGATELDLLPAHPARLQVREGQGVTLVASGLAPDLSATLVIGDRSHELWPEPDGSLRWERADTLHGVAGRVDLRLDQQGSPALEAMLEVTPSRMTQAALETLLADLDRLAPGIAGALGGRSKGSSRSAPEQALMTLESSLGAVASAIPWIARNPIVRKRERATAIPSRTGPTSATDARWITRHPQQTQRARQRGAEVAISRELRLDADTAENQGVMGLLRKMQALAEGLSALLATERQRIEQSRAAREAFVTRHGNLFQELDQPRLEAIRQRTERLQALHRQLSALPSRMRLPPGLRSAAFMRTPKVETHPGYWRLFQVWQQLRELEAGEPPPGVAPIDSLDRLYELWCALTLREALQLWAGKKEGTCLALHEDHWFADLAPGTELVRFVHGDRSAHLIYEPAYAYGDHDAEVGKLVRGNPWRPDLVIELRDAGVLVELHVLDAKHRIAHQRPGGVPWEAMDEVWLKYTDTIGHPGTRTPLVASCWILYPGPEDHISLRSPAMLGESWPEGRPRGGAVALYPLEGEARPQLQRLLGVLLAGWG